MSRAHWTEARRIYPSRISAPPSLFQCGPVHHEVTERTEMLRIKHGVRTTFGDVLWDEPLPPVYDSREECVAAIETFVNGFDHSEEEPENDRWCAWNDETLNEYHYWWITVAERPITDEDNTSQL